MIPAGGVRCAARSTRRPLPTGSPAGHRHPTLPGKPVNSPTNRSGCCVCWKTSSVMSINPKPPGRCQPGRFYVRAKGCPGATAASRTAGARRTRLSRASTACGSLVFRRFSHSRMSWLLNRDLETWHRLISTKLNKKIIAHLSNVHSNNCFNSCTTWRVASSPTAIISAARGKPKNIVISGAMGGHR